MNTSLPVLVVDDSRTTALAISDLLHRVGFAEVDVAHDAHSALDHLRDKHYGLVLSDWEMQPMSGDEFLRAIRQDGKLGKVPIIVMTASGGRGASWLAGADAYLRKPFDERELRKAIKGVLGD
jgi:two-component system, chemotaxis family, chemotaxis protein CheY